MSLTLLGAKALGGILGGSDAKYFTVEEMVKGMNLNTLAKNIQQRKTKSGSRASSGVDYPWDKALEEAERLRERFGVGEEEAETPAPVPKEQDDLALKLKQQQNRINALIEKGPDTEAATVKPIHDFGALWKEYSGWEAENEAWYADSRSSAIQSMVAGGLDPKSATWGRRIAAVDRELAARQDQLSTTETGKVLTQNWQSLGKKGGKNMSAHYEKLYGAAPRTGAPGTTPRTASGTTAPRVPSEYLAENPWLSTGVQGSSNPWL